MKLNWTFMKKAGWTRMGSRNLLPLMGKTLENKSLRFQVYMSSVHIWDLENAGKRGKKVEEIVLYDTDYVSDPTIQTMLDDFVLDLKKLNYTQAKKRAILLAKKGQEIDSYPKLATHSLMGVRVAPSGFGPFKLETPFVVIEADWNTFSINDKIDKNNLPACIPAINGGKKSIKVFYRWVQDNQNKIKRMTFNQIQQAMKKAGVEYHYYCRMD